MMGLLKTVEVDQVEIVGPYRVVQVRQATCIVDDGKEISRSFHRKTLYPGDINPISGNYEDTDFSEEEELVSLVCGAVWTPAIKEDYKNHLFNLQKAHVSL
mgnify:CR=1 FL=1